MNWGQLKQAVQDYVHRDDLASMYTTFLALAEQRIYFGEMNSPKVRVSEMQQFATLVDGNRPIGFLEAIKVAENNAPDRPLEYRPMEYMPMETRAYSWNGIVLTLSQDQSFPVDVTYYAKFATPVNDSDENWLMANAPGIYLASMLVEVARWSEDNSKGMLEASNYASAVNSLIAQNSSASHSGSRLTMKLRRTP
jgi:hypothetical protein